jgi:citronellol/citronellal dehydrogenase
VGHVSFHACDIRNEDAVKATVAAIVAQHGRIDGLVNNAGGQYITPLEKSISAKGWDAVVATNLTGGFLMARECYVQAMQAHGGSIVNIVADIWGSMPGMGHSGAARAGMVSFTETAALEWAKKRRAGERGGAGLHRLQRHGPLPTRGRPHAARDARDRAAGPLWQRGRNLGGHRVPAEPGGQFHQRHGAARGRRAAAGAHGLGPGGTRLKTCSKRDAVKPFEGFHRYQTPKVFQK